MTRREIIKYTALFTGAAVSAPIAASLLSGCTPEIDPEVQNLHFFDKNSFILVKDLVDTILPKTNSPSASEVGVHTMIDAMVGTVYIPVDRSDYQRRFSGLQKEINRGKKFVKCTAEEKLEKLTLIELSKTGELQAAREAFKDLKQQTIAYYLSTEQIGKEFLNYLPIPVTYEPCISLESVGGKAWAL